MADPPERGTWRDTYALHFPRKETKKRDTPFDKNVGLDGYDRGEGTDVPTHPRLRRPGEDGPAADPFTAADRKKLGGR